MRWCSYWQWVQLFTAVEISHKVWPSFTSAFSLYIFVVFNTNPTSVWKQVVVYGFGWAPPLWRTGFSRGRVLYIHPVIELFSLMNHWVTTLLFRPSPWSTSLTAPHWNIWGRRKIRGEQSRFFELERWDNGSSGTAMNVTESNFWQRLCSLFSCAASSHLIQKSLRDILAWHTVSAVGHRVVSQQWGSGSVPAQVFFSGGYLCGFCPSLWDLLETLNCEFEWFVHGPLDEPVTSLTRVPLGG